MMFRWWMAPAIGVGICAIANGALVAMSLRVRPQKVEERPYAASALEDGRAAARAAFDEHRWRLEHAVDATGVTIRLEGVGDARPAAGLVRLYRPDDLSADRTLDWPDPTRPLRCALPRPGAWSVHVMLGDASGASFASDLRLNRP